MYKIIITFLILGISSFCDTFFVTAQFGLNNNKDNIDPIKNDIQDGKYLDHDDPELMEAMQMFADMSPEEMRDTLGDLMAMFPDDPEMIAELEEAMAEISGMDKDEINKSMEEIMDEEMAAKAMADTLQMLKEADESALVKILERKDLILDSVIATGVMSEEEIELFKADPSLWEAELIAIWEELKKQGDESSLGSSSDEL